MERHGGISLLILNDNTRPLTLSLSSLIHTHRHICSQTRNASMKTPLTFLAVLSAALLSTTRYGVVQGGNILSHTLFAPRNHPNNQLNNHPHPNNDPLPPPSTVPHLEWNSELGHNPLNQQSRQGGDRAQEFQPYANFAIQDQQLFGTTADAEPGCRTRDRVYLPDMQSFLIKVPLTYLEAVQACRACRSELVLIDGTNVDHFREAFTSLGLYGDQRFWIKSWFGEQLERQGFCPAVTVNALMGNRLESITEDCQTRFYALCY